MTAIQLFIQKHWKSDVPECDGDVPVVECLLYEKSVPSTTRQYRLHCTENALELEEISSDAAPFKDRLVWTDILGIYRFSTINSMGSFVSLPILKLVKKMKVPMRDQDLVLFACVPKNRHKKKQNKKKTTKRIQAQWIFRYTGDNEDKYLQKLLASIQFLSDPRVYCPETDALSPELLKKIQDMDLNESEPILPKRKFLIVINPVGGTGRGKEIYQEQVASIFQQSNIECEEMVTQRQAHATEIMTQIPLNHYDCIVSVGGDGLLSEIVQGLMSRPHDWAQAICQPIGVIPGGSGNGLSASLLYRANEKLDVLNAAFSVAKGIIQKLDLATTINTKGNKIYSFLSLEWAFIADVDIESEKYRRPFGDLRFTISAIQKLLFCRKPFHGTLHYLPEDCNYKKLLKESVTTSQSATEGPRLDLLELTPSTEWKELSGHFDLFWGMNVSHASRDAIVTPQASPDDGFMHILILHTGSGSGNAQIKRSKLLRVLLSMETGKHVDKKYVTLIKTRAFKLQVHNPKDRLCVDGELVDGPEIQVEMHQQLGRILTLQPKKLVEIVQ